MLIEAILAGFLGLGLPPAPPAESVAHKCEWGSSKVGCDTNHGGGREAPNPDKGDKGGKKK